MRSPRFSSSVLAQEMTVVMTDLSSGQSVGAVTLTDSEYGTVFTPQLAGLPAGLHGFHVHANGSCEALSKDGQRYFMQHGVLACGS
ncbi:superoxide dismutase [Vibrio paracholerae 877-163]|nr:superoxide dismutase [Vibrio paracholerae 877-163]MBJ6975978.1 superoxide dismutase family protein [Vibrio cholerae]SYZ81428.1 superoxide dismutase [Vibrio paracholerae]